MMNIKPHYLHSNYSHKKITSKTRCLFFLFLVNIPLEVLSRAIRQEKEIEEKQIKKCVRYFSVAMRKYSDKK